MGCEIKAAAVNLESFWPMLEKSIRGGVTGCEKQQSDALFLL